MAAEMPFRFWNRALIGDGCWEWQGARPNNHYGLFSFGRKRIGAHRVAYELWFGPIPDDLWVLHHCDNKGCVRPDHLFLGTAADNAADKVAKGRQYRPAPTHCRNGHPFDDTNTRRMADGTRRCRMCEAETARRYRLRRRDPETLPVGKHPRPFRTHCKRGHELTPDNVYVKSGTPHIRHCKICMYERQRQWYRRRKAIGR